MINIGFFSDNSEIIRKSPVVIVKTFVVLQMTAVAVFFLAGILADYGELYENLPFSNSFSFHIAQAIGLFILETLLIFYIFFRWHKEYYEVKNENIVHSQGIIFRQKNVIPLKNIYSTSCRQGPLGRLTKYGTVNLHGKYSEKIFALDHIPEPQKYAELIIELKSTLSNFNPKSTNVTLEKLLSKGEHEKLEFKKSFRWDFHQNKVNKNLEKAIMKSIAAFLNSNGGQLIIGVDDSGNITGLEHDYKSLPKYGSDSFHNHFTNVFHSMIGPEFRQYVDLSFHHVAENQCCLINVTPVNKPAYLKSDDGEEFYIRTGNGTTSLKLSEAAAYVDSHWKRRLI